MWGVGESWCDGARIDVEDIATADCKSLCGKDVNGDIKCSDDSVHPVHYSSVSVH